MQIPAGNHLVQQIYNCYLDITCLERDNSLPIPILNIGAGRRFAIEKQLYIRGCKYVCDRIDVDDCYVAFPTIGHCWMCSVEDMTPVETDGYPLDGESIRPLLEGEGSLKRQAIFWHFPAYLQGEYGMDTVWRTTPVGAVRQGDYKLLEFFEDGHLELYNLEKDPGEIYNLADSDPEKTKSLYALMSEWRESLDVPYPLDRNPDYAPSSIPRPIKMEDRTGIYIPNYLKGK